MRHSRNCLSQHPGICANVTNTIHFRTPPTLAHQPTYPPWHITHASTPPTPLTLVRIARHFSNLFNSCQQYLILLENSMLPKNSHPNSNTGWSKKNESKIEFLIIGIQKKITFHAFVFELSNHFLKILQSLGAKEKNKKKI